MKPFRWTLHAENKLKRREIDPAEVETTLCQPDYLTVSQSSRTVYTRRYFDSLLQSDMLLRVVVEETPMEAVIITLYKTSNFKKYEIGETS